MLIYFSLIICLIIILCGINLFLAVHSPDVEKISPFECGISPIYGQTRTPFTVQYYLVGLLFLIFDLEISLLFPLGVYLEQVSIYGFLIAAIFYIILTLGFLIEIASGALNFTEFNKK